MHSMMGEMRVNHRTRALTLASPSPSAMGPFLSRCAGEDKMATWAMAPGRRLDGGRRRKRHLDREPAALARLRADIDRVAKHLGNAVDDGKAQPQAGRPLAIGLKAMEFLEDEFQFLFRDAGPGIVNFD